MDKLYISDLRNLASLKCSYDVPSKILFDYHMLTVVLLCPIAVLLLYSASLRKFYLPLAKLVNACLILQFTCAALFFKFYPYADNEANCIEIVLSRLNTIVEMFAELHQVYFVAFAVGIGHYFFRTPKWVPSSLCQSTISLVSVLKVATAVMVVSIMGSFLTHRGSLNAIEDLWTVFVAMSQIYIIHTAKRVMSDVTGNYHDNFIVSVHDSSISIFQSLSVVQLFLSSFCLVCRLTSAAQFVQKDSMYNLQSVVSSVDFVCSFLFFLKVLIIKEKTKVTVQIVSGSGHSV
jgi:hypothetical protein